MDTSQASLKTVKAALRGAGLAELLRNELFRALSETVPRLQREAIDLISLLNDPNISEADRQSALFTLDDILHPYLHKGRVGFDVNDVEGLGMEASHSPEMKQAIADLNAAEKSFAERLLEALHEKNMSQTELAKALEVSSSAVSMMLSRSCRPQKRTIIRIAEALDMSPEELWSESSASKTST